MLSCDRQCSACSPNSTCVGDVGEEMLMSLAGGGTRGRPEGRPEPHGAPNMLILYELRGTHRQDAFLHGRDDAWRSGRRVDGSLGGKHREAVDLGLDRCGQFCELRHVLRQEGPQAGTIRHLVRHRWGPPRQSRPKAPARSWGL